jgi:Family of unknown function (DUF6166)
MRKYIGVPESAHWQHVGGCIVEDLDQQPGIGGGGRILDPRFDLSNHSPTGFAWGYCGSGPAQLALAILADACGSDATALKYYQAFKNDHIATLPRGAFSIDQAGVLSWLKLHQEKTA